MIYDKVNKVIKKRFESPLSRYQIGLEKTMKAGNFIFACVNFFYYRCYKINLNRDGSYIDSPVRIKYKKATINPINDNDKYTLTVALSNEDIGKNSQGISKINPFLNKYNWEGINDP